MELWLILQGTGTVILAGVAIGSHLWMRSKNGEERRQTETTLKNNVEHLKETVEKIPCVKNTTYMENIGQMRAEVENNGKRLENVERKIDELVRNSRGRE